MIENYEVVIVGGGISGLACARRLTELGMTSFRLITENIGGRLPTSADGKVNYGAFYVRSDYRHVLPFVRCTRPFNVTHAMFFHQGQALSFLNWRNLWHLPSLLRFLYFLRQFRREYEQFRRETETVSQKQALESHPWLKRLMREPAVELVTRFGIQYWADRFLDNLVRATTFIDIRHISSCYFAAVCLPIIMRTYEFEFQRDRLTDPFSSLIERDTVTGIGTGCERRWRITTAGGRQLEANHVVVATPLNRSQQLVPITEPVNPATSVFMFHVRGQLKPAYHGRSMYFFPPESSDIVMVHEPDKTCLFYSQSMTPDLGAYFEHHAVIFQKHWDPALFLGPHVLESDRGEGLYLIGDHSVCSLEDAYITGLFAANRICGHSEKNGGVAQTCFERLGGGAIRGLTEDRCLGESSRISFLLFLCHPDIQRDVWATPSDRVLQRRPAA